MLSVMNDLHPADLSCAQAYLDAVGMGCGIREDILDRPLGQSFCALVFLLLDRNFHAEFYIFSCRTVHAVFLIW